MRLVEGSANEVGTNADVFRCSAPFVSLMLEGKSPVVNFGSSWNGCKKPAPSRSDN